MTTYGYVFLHKTLLYRISHILIYLQFLTLLNALINCSSATFPRESSFKVGTSFYAQLMLADCSTDL